MSGVGVRDAIAAVVGGVGGAIEGGAVVLCWWTGVVDVTSAAVRCNQVEGARTFGGRAKYCKVSMGNYNRGANHQLHLSPPFYENRECAFPARVSPVITCGLACGRTDTPGSIEGVATSASSPTSNNGGGLLTQDRVRCLTSHHHPTASFLDTLTRICRRHVHENGRVIQGLANVGYHPARLGWHWRRQTITCVDCSSDPRAFCHSQDLTCNEFDRRCARGSLLALQTCGGSAAVKRSAVLDHRWRNTPSMIERRHRHVRASVYLGYR